MSTTNGQEADTHPAMVQLRVKAPAALLDTVDAMAARESRSRSNMFRVLVAEAIAARQGKTNN